MTTENATSTTPTTMAAVVGRRCGSPDVLAIEHVPIPTPKAGEVLVQVAAAVAQRARLALPHRHALLPAGHRRTATSEAHHPWRRCRRHRRGDGCRA